jgi:hypothetical protein
MGIFAFFLSPTSGLATFLQVTLGIFFTTVFGGKPLIKPAVAPWFYVPLSLYATVVAVPSVAAFFIGMAVVDLYQRHVLQRRLDNLNNRPFYAEALSNPPPRNPKRNPVLGLTKSEWTVFVSAAALAFGLLEWRRRSKYRKQEALANDVRKRGLLSTAGVEFVYYAFKLVATIGSLFSFGLWVVPPFQRIPIIADMIRSFGRLFMDDDRFFQQQGRPQARSSEEGDLEDRRFKLPKKPDYYQEPIDSSTSSSSEDNDDDYRDAAWTHGSGWRRGERPNDSYFRTDGARSGEHRKRSERMRSRFNSESYEQEESMCDARFADGPEDIFDKAFSLKAWIKRAKNELKRLLAKYKVHVGLIAVAIIFACSFFIYLRYKSEVEEGRGKNKGGRGSRKRVPTVPKAKLRKKFIIYDEQTIAELYVNGESVTPSEWMNMELPDGTYVIIYDDGDGRFHEDVIMVNPFLDNSDEPRYGYDDAGQPMNTKADLYAEAMRWRPNPAPPQPPVGEIPQVPAPEKKRKRNKGKKPEEPPKEALVKASDRVMTQAAFQTVGKVLDATGHRLQYCVGTIQGVVMNKHSYNDATHFEFAGKKFAKTPVRGDVVDLHDDLCICLPFDGCPATRKNLFDVPEQGQRIYVLNADSTANGMVTDVSHGDVRHTASTVAGDCGSPYVNANGKIIGFHRAAGDSTTNVGIAVSERFRAVFDGAVPKNV